MALTLADAVRTVLEKKFTLSDLPGFPQEIYERQLSIYNEADRWFKGKALEETVASAGKNIDKYPLKINPLVSTVLKHAHILFGEVNNDGRPLVHTKMMPVNETDNAKKTAQEAEDALNHLWWENNGRALMLENGVLSQIYGGCVFKATYVPWEKWRKYPIRIERVHPRSFIGRPNAGDMYRLAEGWIVSNMSLDEARKWGYKGFDQNPTYVEYWNQKIRRAWVNKDEAVFPLPIPDQDQEDYPLSGENPFGFVPMVYIPHLRIGTFKGQNAIDHLKGLVKELNSRFADFGDAVNDDSHKHIGMRNVNGAPEVRRIAEGLTVVDLGSAGNITGSEKDPDLFEIQSNRASAPMGTLLSELLDQYRRDSFVPAVAEGEDEGSQRSALTLATRFWPLTAHAGMERVYFSDGLDVFNNYLLRMMAKKEMGDINESHTQMRSKQSWAPMLPRDREAEIQEWAIRAQNKISSIEHLIEMTRDIDDPQEEREKIIDWFTEITEIEANAKAKAAQRYPSASNFGNNGGGE